MNCDTQNHIILAALKRGQSLTHIDAMKLGAGYKLSTRIGELKSAGAKIGSNWVKRNGRMVRLYWLARAK